VRGFDMVFDSACRIRSLVTPQTYLLVSRAELTLCRSGEGQGNRGSCAGITPIISALEIPQPPSRRSGPVVCEGHRWPQPVYGTIVAMCRADHSDQALDMNSSGNPG
jgi:hypothetical protein